MNRNLTIAVTGKGGTGKTVISSIMISLLSQQDGHLKILAIDADPAMSLSSALGIRVRKTVGDIREEVYRDSLQPTPGSVSLDLMIENQLWGIVEKTPDFQFLSVGRPEGPGCYCLINDMMRHMLDKMYGKFDYTVIDCEAGMEHISRRTIRNMDFLFIVTDPTKRGTETAKAIEALAKKLEVRFARSCLIVNKVTEQDRDFCRESGMAIMGTIPLDENITRYDREGKPFLFLPDDSPAVIAIAELMTRTVSSTGESSWKMCCHKYSLTLPPTSRSTRSSLKGKSGRQ
ncbi:MAG: AAA family ATPase [Syntrophales bacterium]|nr:AAA family ATPase [Syntrophales bacterium]